MSAIPPNSIGSALQSSAAQQVQSRERENEDNLRTDASRRLTGQGSADIIEIEATDTDDNEVHADTAGTGGQGRFDAPPEELESESPESACVRIDSDGRPHLDVSA